MKTVSDAFDAHLKQQVTTLCTCLTVRRRDDAAFYFTDHDLPVFLDTAKYVPWSSFSRSSIQTGIDLEIDQMEINGILNSGAISRDDIAEGLFDFAEVEVVAINYKAPNEGRTTLRKGWIGEVTMDENGTFHAELRGLTQVLSYRIGEAYTPECRADLGDRRCGIPLDPVRWQPGQTYKVGDTVLGVINAARAFVNLPIVNPGFEADPLNAIVTAPTGWTYYGPADGRWCFHTSGFGLTNPKQGSQFAQATRNGFTKPVEAGMFQDIDLVAAGISAGNLDSGLCRLVFSAWTARTEHDQTLRVRVHTLDANGLSTTIFDSGSAQWREDTWIEVSASDRLVPVGARKLRVDLWAKRRGDVDAGPCFDAITASINLPDGNLGNADQFGGVVQKATVAGISGDTEPAFTNLLGGTTADNTVTWAAAKGWKKVTEVDAVIDAKTLVPLYISDAVGYYDGGLLVWETGRNAGKAQEIKTWTGGRLTLFQRPFHIPQVGDRFVLHPGCDKRRGTCQEKFDNVVNFRGEPDVPGQDEYYKTPNAPAQ